MDPHQPPPPKKIITRIVRPYWYSIFRIIDGAGYFSLSVFSKRQSAISGFFFSALDACVANAILSSRDAIFSDYRRIFGTQGAQNNSKFFIFGPFLTGQR